MEVMKNDVATAKQQRDKKFAEYVENNPIEIYVDYRDELSDEQIERILEGHADDVSIEIEDNYFDSIDHDDYYWESMAEDLKVDKDEIMDWLDDEGFWPSTYLSGSGWNQLIRNSRAYITATMWNVDWNFDAWAYGQPIYYSDVKDVLKILGINPAEFKALRTGGSMTSGDGQFRGYFPNMPNRMPAVRIEDLYENMCALYDGVLNFCLADLEDVIEVASSDSKYITFRKGTNIVMYNFMNGAGITEAQLINDVTVKRSEVTFRNDAKIRYGIQECYGFVGEFWSAGGVRNGK